MRKGFWVWWISWKLKGPLVRAGWCETVDEGATCGWEEEERGGAWRREGEFETREKVRKRGEGKMDALRSLSCPVEQIRDV
jgi:hypothetical protein